MEKARDIPLNRDMMLAIFDHLTIKRIEVYAGLYRINEITKAIHHAFIFAEPDEVRKQLEMACKELNIDWKSPTKAPSGATGVCQTCKGDGRGIKITKEGIGIFTPIKCPDCKGTGKQSGEKGEVGVQQTELEEAVKKVAHKAKKEDMKTWDEVMK